MKEDERKWCGLRLSVLGSAPHESRSREGQRRKVIEEEKGAIFRLFLRFFVRRIGFNFRDFGWEIDPIPLGSFLKRGEDHVWRSISSTPIRLSWCLLKNSSGLQCFCRVLRAWIVSDFYILGSLLFRLLLSSLLRVIFFPRKLIRLFFCLVADIVPKVLVWCLLFESGSAVGLVCIIVSEFWIAVHVWLLLIPHKIEKRLLEGGVRSSSLQLDRVTLSS